MKKFARFLFETDFGPFIAWWAVAGAFFGLLIILEVRGITALALAGVVLVALVGVSVMSMVGVAAFVFALWRRRWNRAIGQLLLGVVSVPLFCLGALLSEVCGRSIACATSTGARRATVANGAGQLEFKVEYRPAHPFLAEYDKCIMFPSGKRLGLWPDTGGAGAFAVYRLPTGEYYLVDGLEHDFIRNDYRVNVTNETVEMMCGEKWFAIPDGTLAVTSYGNKGVTIKTADGEKSVNDDGVAIADSLKGRRYLGLLHPSGRFEPGEGDPFADIVEPKWKPVKLGGGEVPFSLECKRWKGSHHYRVVFASGARIALDSTRRIGEEGYSLYALEDGRYHLLEAQSQDVSWRKEWRIDAVGEAVEVMFKDHWGKYGDMWVKIPNGAISCHNSIGVNGGKDGAPLSVSIKVDTENGKVEGHDFVPVGDSLSNAKFIGTFQPPDDELRPRNRKGGRN